MSKTERAKQFMPFDALKGLQEALRVKESEREMIEKNDVPEDDAREISNTLLGLKKGDVVAVDYFASGKILSVQGAAKLKFSEQKIFVDGEEILLSDIMSIKVVADELH